MRLAWLTDIHLNCVEPADRRRFLESVGQQAEAVAVTGDIGESHTVAEYLREMEDVLQGRVYFVLGNHDFYRSSVAQTRAVMADLARASQQLVYMTARSVVELTANTALIGHDGWADARLGNFDASDVILNDYWLIQELHHWTNPWELDKDSLREALQRLADEAASHFERVLTRHNKSP